MSNYTCIHIYLGESDDEAVDTWQVDDFPIRPMAGEKISVWSTRDRRGDYVHKNAKIVFEGIVTRIEHVFEERGNDAQHNHTVHFVEIFMKEIEKDK